MLRRERGRAGEREREREGDLKQCSYDTIKTAESSEKFRGKWRTFANLTRVN
jgi:hypothetical protein